MLAVLIVAPPARASAQGSAPAADPPVLERSLYKTVVFEGATNAIDLLLFGSLLGGHIYAGPTFLAVNATAAALLYYGHEVAWGYLGPPDADYDVNTNVLKGITFRLASSTRAPTPSATASPATRSPPAASWSAARSARLSSTSPASTAGSSTTSTVAGSPRLR